MSDLIEIANGARVSDSIAMGMRFEPEYFNTGIGSLEELRSKSVSLADSRLRNAAPPASNGNGALDGVYDSSLFHRPSRGERRNNFFRLRNSRERRMKSFLEDKLEQREEYRHDRIYTDKHQQHHDAQGRMHINYPIETSFESTESILREIFGYTIEQAARVTNFYSSPHEALRHQIALSQVKPDLTLSKVMDIGGVMATGPDDKVYLISPEVLDRSHTDIQDVTPGKIVSYLSSFGAVEDGSVGGEYRVTDIGPLSIITIDGRTRKIKNNNSLSLILETEVGVEGLEITGGVEMAPIHINPGLLGEFEGGYRMDPYDASQGRPIIRKPSSTGGI